MKFLGKLQARQIEEMGDLVELIGTGIIIFSVVKGGFGTVIGGMYSPAKFEIPILADFGLLIFLSGLILKFLGRLLEEFTSTRLFSFMVSLVLMMAYLNSLF